MKHQTFNFEQVQPLELDLASVSLIGKHHKTKIIRESPQTTTVFSKLQQVLGWEHGYLMAVIFINISCVFDIMDNIFTRFSQQTGIDVLDVTLSRVLINFIVSSIAVKKYGADVR